MMIVRHFLLFIVTLNVSVSFAQHDPRFEKIQNYFSIDELILGEWELVQTETEMDETVILDTIITEKDSMRFVAFKFKKCFLSNFNSLYFFRTEQFFQMSSYQILKDSLTKTLYLELFEHESKTVQSRFVIEDFAFNQLILVEYLLDSEGTKTKVRYNYQRSESMAERSIGTWLHYGDFEIYNVAHTDTAAHHFKRVLRGQDIRDSIAIDDITYQLEFRANETYFSFATGGVLGSVTIGAYKIDLVNQHIYFLEKDAIVYDYYLPSNSEIVFQLNPELTKSRN